MTNTKRLEEIHIESSFMTTELQVMKTYAISKNDVIDLAIAAFRKIRELSINDDVTERP